MHGTQLLGALDSLQRGFAVLPVEPGGKKPFTQYAPRGVNSATPVVEQVRAWFAARPDLNYGVRTGEGVVVLDVDAEDALERVRRLGLPRTMTVQTARGLHAYFLWDEDAASRPILGPKSHIDVKGRGGYVVGAGSVHETGVIYAVIDNSPLSRPPGWLIDAMQTRGATSEVDIAGSRASSTGPDSTVGNILFDELPKAIRALLSDASDGRNARTYTVVRDLVKRDFDDRTIIRIVLASRLGSKARESGNATAYLRQMISSAKTWSSRQKPAPAPDEFRAALSSAGLRGNRMRLLELMASTANDRSLVVMGVRDAALGAALPVSTARSNIQAAVRDGWLRVAFRPSRGTKKKTIYELAVPCGHGLPSGSCPRPRADTTAPCGQNVSGPALPLDHDAFRDSRTSVAFPTLAALSADETRSNALLAAMTGVTTRTIRRHLVRLRADGLALPDVDGHRRVRDLDGALNECARRRGVEGIGAQERSRIQDERRARRRAQEEYREEERMRGMTEGSNIEPPSTLESRPVGTDAGGRS